MILELFGFIVLVSLVLIIIGLLKPDESAQAIVGFFFLFILSIILITGNLEVENGATINNSFNYDDTGVLSNSSQTIAISYTQFNDTTSHRIGYWLAIASSVGMFGVLFSLRRAYKIRKSDQDEE